MGEWDQMESAGGSELARVAHQRPQNGKNGRKSGNEEVAEGGCLCMGNMKRVLSSDARWKRPETESCHPDNHELG